MSKCRTLTKEEDQKRLADRKEMVRLYINNLYGIINDESRKEGQDFGFLQLAFARLAEDCKYVNELEVDVQWKAAIGWYDNER